MTAPLKAIDGNADLATLMNDLRQAGACRRAHVGAGATRAKRPRAASDGAPYPQNAPAILAANAKDVAEDRASGAAGYFIDRLTLTQARVDAMADGIAVVRNVADPGRRRHRKLAAAERHDHRARPRAARRRRRDFRKPSQLPRQPGLGEETRLVRQSEVRNWACCPLATLEPG